MRLNVDFNFLIVVFFAVDVCWRNPASWDYRVVFESGGLLLHLVDLCNGEFAAIFLVGPSALNFNVWLRLKPVLCADSAAGVDVFHGADSVELSWGVGVRIGACADVSLVAGKCLICVGWARVDWAVVTVFCLFTAALYKLWISLHPIGDRLGCGWQFVLELMNLFLLFFDALLLGRQKGQNFLGYGDLNNTIRVFGELLDDFFLQLLSAHGESWRHGQNNFVLVVFIICLFSNNKSFRLFIMSFLLHLLFCNKLHPVI